MVTQQIKKISNTLETQIDHKYHPNSILDKDIKGKSVKTWKILMDLII